MKVFFDSSVIIAAVLTRGAARQLLAAVAQAKWTPMVSQYVLEEFDRFVAGRPQLPRGAVRSLRDYVLNTARVVPPAHSRHEVMNDPADSPILRSALAAGADYLASYDQHLLALDPYEGLRIVNIASLLDELRTTHGKI
jgi:putative PIN family toxin of toxin-antitoxin system